MIPKTKIIKLSGSKLAELNSAVYERDNGCCVVCSRYVESGTKFHHEPCGAGRKSDEITKAVLLCGECHYKRHHTGEARVVKEKIEEYLHKLYGDEK